LHRLGRERTTGVERNGLLTHGTRVPPECCGMPSKVDSLENFARRLSNWLNWIAGAGLVAMLVLVAADIVAAKSFKWPIPGGMEMVGFLGVVIVAFSIAETQVLRGHIEVEFLVARLPGAARKAIGTIVYGFGMVLFAVLAWESYRFGHTLQASGEVSMTQGIPFYPFVYGMALCCVSVFLVLLVQLLKAVAES